MFLRNKIAAGALLLGALGIGPALSLDVLPADAAQCNISVTRPWVVGHATMKSRTSLRSCVGHEKVEASIWEDEWRDRQRAKKTSRHHLTSVVTATWNCDGNGRDSFKNEGRARANGTNYSGVGGWKTLTC